MYIFYVTGSHYRSETYYWTIPAKSTNYTFYVAINDDHRADGNKTFELIISKPRIPSLPSRVVVFDQATLTIVDDDGKYVYN